jgi:Putative Actinobacterial Holin-X, holin superfamily III
MAVSTRPDAHIKTHSADLDEASVGQLAARLSEQVSRLVHDELALAQLEAKQKAKRLGIGVGMFGGSGVMAVFGAGCAITAAVLGLTNVVAAWLAALIVAGVLFALAGVLALAGKSGVQHAAPPIPTDAVESTKADVAAVRQAVRR